MSDDVKLYHGHRERLRKRLLASPELMEDYEILELLLGYVHTRRDTKPISKQLLAEFGNLSSVFNCHPAEREKIEGFGASCDIFFLLLREIIARYFTEPIQAKKAVSINDIALLARSRLDGLEHEEVWIALLDNGNRLLNFKKVNSGTLDSAVLTPRIVAEFALAHKASAVVLVHNHPGGTSRASWADVETTKHTKNVLQLMGIRLIDHLIVADGKILSLVNNHLLE